MKLPRKLLFLVLFAVFPLLSQEIDFISENIPLELRENANAVVRDNSIAITIEDIDKMVVSKREVVTVLNKLGNTDAKIVEYYDNDTKITKLSAIIYDAFGNQIKKFKERDFLDVSAVSGGTLYSDSRVKYIDYTPISYPYTIVFESTYKTSSTGFVPSWFPINGYYISVEKSQYKLNNLKKIKARKKEKSFDGYSIEDKSNEFDFNYILTNQKAIEYENQSPNSIDFMPYLMVGVNSFALKNVIGKADNWLEFGKWRYDYLKNGNDELSEEIKQKALKLVENIEDPIEKAKIIYQFMQNRTRYISVQEGIGGWKPIPANQVDKVGYGDCKGLTNYMKALLDAVGVQSHYSVIWAGNEKRSIEKDFFGMQGNHVILNLPHEGKDIWLECTSQTTPFGFLGDFTDDRDVLVITPEGGIIKRTAIYKDEVNLQTINGEIELTASGDVKGKIKRVSKGIQYDNKSYLDGYTDEELIKNYKSRVWSYNNNLEVDAFELNNDKENIIFTEDLELSIKNFASINENDFLFRVNIFNRESFVPKRYRKRKLPLKIRRGYKDVDEYTVKIPDTYKIEYLPEPKELSTKFGTYTISFKQIDETTFSYKKEILIIEGTHPKEEYKKYRSFRRSIAKYENLRIALIKK